MTLLRDWWSDRRARRLLAEPAASGAAPSGVDMGALLAQIRRQSFAVVPDFYTAAECARLRAEVDRVMSEHPQCVRVDRVGADHRLFGAEHGSAAIAAFHGDPFAHGIAEAYFGGRIVNLATLAGRLEARQGNSGSGQGWHRDAFHFQFKSIIYLSDVGPENGPFQIVVGSHRLPWLVHDTLRFALDPRNSRLADAAAERVIASRPRRLRTVTAPAGTLLLIDTSAIHRGSPIRQGVRYALTNYVYPTYRVGETLLQNLEPMLKPAG